MTKEQLLDRLSNLIDLYTNKCDELGLDIDCASLTVDCVSEGVVIYGDYTHPTDTQEKYCIRPTALIGYVTQKIIWFEERHESTSVPREVEFYTLKDGKWQIDKDY